jgi:hypothetical protein
MCGVTEAISFCEPHSIFYPQVGELMRLTHVGYTAIGLGAHQTDEMVERATKEIGVAGLSAGSTRLSCQQTIVQLRHYMTFFTSLLLHLIAGGVYGARVSGGGSGGTVVVLCERSALPALQVRMPRLLQRFSRQSCICRSWPRVSPLALHSPALFSSYSLGCSTEGIGFHGTGDCALRKGRKFNFYK